MSYDDDSSFVSNTDATIHGTSSTSGESIISDNNNITTSSSTSSDHDLSVPEPGTGFMNNEKSERGIMIFNTVLRPFCANSSKKGKEKISESSVSSKMKAFVGPESGASSSNTTTNKQREYWLSIFNAICMPSSIVNVGTNNNRSDSNSSNKAKCLAGYEASVRLMEPLMVSCAEAVQQNDLNRATEIVKEIRLLALQQSGALIKVSTYFIEALNRRIHENVNKQDSNINVEYNSYDVMLKYYKIYPYLKFAYSTANQAILQAFGNCDRVHVVDLGLYQVFQWRELMLALAARPGGPPVIRLTGFRPPQLPAFRFTGIGPLHLAADDLQDVGRKLAELAERNGLEFKFCGIEASTLAEIDVSALNIKPSNVEAVAVNSVFRLHDELARPGAVEKVMDSIKQMKPKIVTITEQEAGQNTGGVFLDRFKEAWHHYSIMFDALENSYLSSRSSQDLAMIEKYLQRQINNVIACHGTKQMEGLETLDQWQTRMNSAGFNAVCFSSNTYKRATMLLPLFGSKEVYSIENKDWCLMLSRHKRPLIAASAWQLYC